MSFIPFLSSHAFYLYLEASFGPAICPTSTSDSFISVHTRLESLFLREEDIFPHQICALGKTVLVSPPYVKWFVFQVRLSARLIGRCAHGSWLARGRSSARTTYFPVWST